MKLVATYPYTDEAGALLYEVLRYEPKTFRQRRVTADGPVWGLGDVRRVPYRLAQLRAAIDLGRAIVVVEGEKDVDALDALNVNATTNSGGTGWHWPPQYAEHFRGAKRVIVVADADGVGRAAAQQRAELLASVVPEVRILDLAPDRDDGFDVSDWVATGGSRDELLALLKAAPLVVPSSLPTAARVAGVESLADLLHGDVEATNYLIEGLLPEGGIALLSARPKVGKSVLAQNAALQVACGGELLGRRCRQGAVLYLAMEERRETVLDRFRAMGATAAAPIHFLIGRPPDEAMRWLFETTATLSVKLVIIDTLVRLIRLEDIERYGATSNALEPLLALSRERGVAQLWLHHNRKSGEGTNAVSGSNAIVAAVDTTIIMQRSQNGVRTVFSEQRIGVDMEELVVEMDPDTYLIRASGSKAIAEQRAAEQRILERLVEPMTREEAAKLSGQRLSTGRRAVGALIDAGLLVATGTGLKGDPKRYIVAVERRETNRDEAGEIPRFLRPPALFIEPNDGTKNSLLRPGDGTKQDEAGHGGRTGTLADEADEPGRGNVAAVAGGDEW